MIPRSDATTGHGLLRIGISGHTQRIVKGQGMLGKVLGLVTAGAFVGAAVVEILGCFARSRAGKKPLPTQATDEDLAGAQEHDQTAPPAEG